MKNKIIKPENETKKKKVLFIGEGISMAHVVRPYTLAKELDLENYEIHFATFNDFENYIHQPQFKWHQLKTFTPKEFYGKLKKGKALYTRTILKEQIQDDLNLFDKIQPDLIVTDFRPSASLSAELKGIPHIALANGFWSPFSKADIPVPDIPVSRFLGKYLSSKLVKFLFPLIFNKQISAFRKERKHLGLNPLKKSFEAYNKGTITAYMDLPDLTPTQKLSTDHIFLGPVLWEPDMQLPNFKLDPKKKTIYLTLGSSGEVFNIELIIKDLLRQNYQIITTSKVKVQKNVFSSSILPGVKVAKMADLMICHGGSGTIYQALSAGIPAIGICSNLDQQMAMLVVEKKGMGKTFLLKEANPKSISAACSSLLLNANKINLAITKSKINHSDTKRNFNKVVAQLCPIAKCKKTSVVSQAIKQYKSKKESILIKPLLDLEDEIEINIALTNEAKESSYQLMYDVYLEKGYIQKNDSKKHCLPSSTINHTVTFVAITDNEVIGTLSVIQNNLTGLPAESIYAQELKELKHTHNIGEITSLGIKKEARFSTKILAKLMNAAYLYSYQLLNISHFIITVNPRHHTFYQKKLLFETKGPIKKYDKVSGTPAILLALDLKLVQKVIEDNNYITRKSLYKYFINIEEGAVFLNQLKGLKSESSHTIS